MALTKCRTLFAFGTLISILSTGCVNGPRTFHAKTGRSEYILCRSDKCAETAQVVQGKPNKIIDGVGWVLGIPRKVVLWDRRVDNHSVQPETVAEVASFVETNGLENVCVRVNQYAPIDEFKRLSENDRVSPGWRYTMGTLSVVGYTMLPGRLLGGDGYNPYTNSVYVYSDVPALGMEAAAFAVDVQGRKYPGTYAAANQLPLVGIWHETINTQDTLAYVKSHGTPEQQEEAQRILYPNYGASVGGSFDSVLGAGPIFEVGGAIVGHVTNAVESEFIQPNYEDTAWLESYEKNSETSMRLVNAGGKSGSPGIVRIAASR